MDDILKAKLVETTLEATRQRMKHDANEAGSAIAEVNFGEAQRFQTALKVLDEITNQKDRYYTVKLKIA